MDKDKDLKAYVDALQAALQAVEKAKGLGITSPVCVTAPSINLASAASDVLRQALRLAKEGN